MAPAAARSSSAARRTKPARQPAAQPDAAANLRQVVSQGRKVQANSKTLSFKDSRKHVTDEPAAASRSGAAHAKPDVDHMIDAADSDDGSDGSSETDDVDIPDAPPAAKQAAAGAEAAAEPSFADMLASAGQAGVVKVNENKTDGALLSTSGGSSALAGADNAPLTAPHLTSLLTTALQTKDASLLKTCLSPRTTPASLNTIRATIERLPSPLIVTLLGHIADVMHRRPGRAGSLMVWVQWSLVCHGGYIASLTSSKPDPSSNLITVGTQGRDEATQLVKKLRALDQVCTERRRNLERLLQLKGKLDVLVAQAKLRRDRVELKQKQHDHDSKKRVWIEDKDGGEEVTVGPNGVVPAGAVIDVEALMPTEATPRGLSKKKTATSKSLEALAKSGVVFDSESSGDEDGEDGVIPVSFMAKPGRGSGSEEDEDDSDEADDDGSDAEVNGYLDVEAEETSAEEEEESSEEEEDDDDGDLMSDEDDEDEDEDEDEED